MCQLEPTSYEYKSLANNDVPYIFVIYTCKLLDLSCPSGYLRIKTWILFS